MNESTSRNRTYSNAIFISEQPQRKKIVDTSGNNIKMENGKMVTGKRPVDILNSNGANIKGKSRAQLPPITDVSGLPLTDAPVLSPSDNYIHPGWEKAGEILDERRNRLNELRSNPTGKSIPTSNVITDVNGKTLKREPITSKRQLELQKLQVLEVKHQAQQSQLQKQKLIQLKEQKNHS